MGRTYQGIPKAVRALLQAGEHQLVDYKGSELPNDLAKVIAGGANTVALRGTNEPFIVMLGVDEVRHANGTRSGKIVGLLDRKTGAPADLDKVEQSAVNMVRNNIVPIPEVAIDVVGAGATHPFLVMYVCPKDPPYRTDDRYPKRLGSHSTPMGAEDLLQIFIARRTEAFISEIADDNPFSRKLAELDLLIQSISRRLTEMDMDQEYRASELNDDLRHLREDLQELGSATSAEEIAAATEAVRSHLEEELGSGAPDTIRSLLVDIKDNTEPTIEQAYDQVILYRRECWMAFSRAVANQKLSGETAELGLALFRAFFLHTPELSAYSSNKAEAVSWRLPHRVQFEDPGPLSLLFDACWAAVSACQVSTWDPYWAELDAQLERPDVRTLRASLKEPDDSKLSRLRLPSSEREMEAAIIATDILRLRQFLLESPARFTDPVSRLVGWRTRHHQVLFAFPEKDGPVAVTSVPAFESPARPDGLAELRALRRRLGGPGGIRVVRCVPVRGGLLRALNGERHS